MVRALAALFAFLFLLFQAVVLYKDVVLLDDGPMRQFAAMAERLGSVAIATWYFLYFLPCITAVVIFIILLIQEVMSSRRRRQSRG